MLCCSPDFTNPSSDARKQAVEHEVAMIRVARALGGPRTVCRGLTGKRYPEVSREQGIEWVVEAITALLPVARESEIVLGLENHYKDVQYDIDAIDLRPQSSIAHHGITSKLGEDAVLGSKLKNRSHGGLA